MAKKKAPARKKTVAQKAAPKNAAPVKKKAAVPKPKAAPKKKAATLKAAMSKTQLLEELAENTELTKVQVASVLEELGVIIERHIKKRSVGKFTLPGLLKIQAVKKPARKAQKGVPNPFRPGETMDVAAKPASVKVKVMALKKLKDMVG